MSSIKYLQGRDDILLSFYKLQILENVLGNFLDNK